VSELPFGHTSVMASRAPIVEGELDYFPTPPWAARAGGELIRKLDPGGRSLCWEPACGGGHMAHGLSDYFDEVTATDIHDYGFGTQYDFLHGLKPPGPPNSVCDWIVTNPPFILGAEFVRQAYPRARVGVAMLLRLVFLEGGARHKLFTEECPLSVVAPFSERVPMVKGRYDPNASSATAYAWFIWLKADQGTWKSLPRLTWIPPGSKARLTRESDKAFVQPDKLFEAAE
jgi:hypothetical protein